MPDTAAEFPRRWTGPQFKPSREVRQIEQKAKRAKVNPVAKPAPKLLEKRKADAEKDTAWRKARKVVLERDGKACRNCQHPRGLDVHHVIFRSLGGSDDPSNLIALCQRCHKDAHGHVLKIRWKDDRNPAQSVWFERFE